MLAYGYCDNTTCAIPLILHLLLSVLLPKSGAKFHY